MCQMIKSKGRQQVRHDIAARSDLLVRVLYELLLAWQVKGPYQKRHKCQDVIRPYLSIVYTYLQVLTHDIHMPSLLFRQVIWNVWAKVSSTPPPGERHLPDGGLRTSLLLLLNGIRQTRQVFVPYHYSQCNAILTVIDIHMP